MKKIIITPILITTMFIFTSCSSTSGVSPTQNKALNSVSSLNKKEKTGFMQNSLDSWLDKEWTPTVEKDVNIKKLNEDKKRDFTIQEYIDKTKVYNEKKKSTIKESHLKKIESMPVIGNK